MFAFVDDVFVCFLRGETLLDPCRAFLYVFFYFPASAPRFRGVSREVIVSIASIGLYPSSQASLTSSMLENTSSSIIDLLKDSFLLWLWQVLSLSKRIIYRFGTILTLVFAKGRFFFSKDSSYASLFSTKLAERVMLAFGSMHFWKDMTMFSISTDSASPDYQSTSKLTSPISFWSLSRTANSFKLQTTKSLLF